MAASASGKPAHSAEAASGRQRFLTALFTLACLVIAAPWCIHAAVSLLAAGATTPIDWVPTSFPSRRGSDAFTAAFTSGDVVVASWPDCWLGSPDVASVLDAAASTATLRSARRLASSLSTLPDMRLIYDEPDGEQLWRVTARTSALAGLDYGRFLEDVRRTVAPVVQAHGGTARGISASYTGAMPLINAIQRSLLHDLFASFLTACLVISLVTVIAARGLAAGLLAMIPNLFPMLILFGLLGWQGATLDIGSVMTASVALGMAVDGNFHFLTSFRRALPPQPGRAGRVTAVTAPFEQTAPAVIQTAVVCGIGILTFTPSGFAPTRQFAIMLAVLVALALVGDLVVLPAVLISPVGRLFRRSGGPLPAERLSPPAAAAQGRADPSVGPKPA